MEIFKNDVGRPSNETIQTRRTIKIVIAGLVIAVVAGGGYFIYSRFASNDVSSTNKNAAVATAAYSGDVVTALDNTKGDKKITREDADLITKFSVGAATPNATQKKNADIDGNGKMTSQDARYAMRAANGHGDFNGDGATNSTDVRFCQRIANGIGDVDGDKKVTKNDSDLISKYAVGAATPNTTQKTNADIDGDGKITSQDARNAMRAANGYGDINGDGVINSTDTKILQRITVGYGDVATAADSTKGDGKITQEDADAVSKYAVGSISFTAAQKKAADVDKNGKVNSQDARLIAKKIKK